MKKKKPINFGLKMDFNNLNTILICFLLFTSCESQKKEQLSYNNLQIIYQLNKFKLESEFVETPFDFILERSEKEVFDSIKDQNFEINFKNFLLESAILHCQDLKDKITPLDIIISRGYNVSPILHINFIWNHCDNPTKIQFNLPTLNKELVEIPLNN